MNTSRFLLILVALILVNSFITDAARSVRPIRVAREELEAQFREYRGEMMGYENDKWPARVSPGGPDPHHHFKID